MILLPAPARFGHCAGRRYAQALSGPIVGNVTDTSQAPIALLLLR
jgi:hypothetical protein